MYRRGILWSIPLIVFIILVIIARPVSPQETLVGANWRYAGFDESSSGFNPQNVLNKGNINSLKQTWMIPLASSSLQLGGAQNQRSVSSLLLVNDIIFGIDWPQYVFALKTEDASSLWSSFIFQSDPAIYSIEDEYIQHRMINFFDEKIWFIDLDCSIKGIEAFTGELSVEIPGRILCGDLPLDAKPRNSLIRGVTAPLLYGDILIVTPSGFETVDHSLSYVMGISLETQDVLWKTPLADWNEGNLASGWGQWSIDEESGIVYIGTGSPLPEWNATRRPGANLYSDSIIALDASTGEIVWYYQTTPHDLNGYGCTYNIILGEMDVSGNIRKVVYSACKNGYLYALDAETGNLMWYFDPPVLKRINSGNGNYVKTSNYDEKPWAIYPSSDPYIQCPGALGAVSSSIAFAQDMVYMGVFNQCSMINVAKADKVGDTGVVNATVLYEPVGPVNSTLYAVDASTGESRWHRDFEGFANKGGIVASDNMIFYPAPDGNLYVFDAETGSTVWKRSFGAIGLVIPPIIGANAVGDLVLAQVIGGNPILGFSDVARSAYLFAFNLPPEAATGTLEEEPVPSEYPDTLIYVAVVVTIALLAMLSYFLTRRR